MCDIFLPKADVFIAAGDCNLNCLTKTCLDSTCDIYGLSVVNFNQGPTCFKGENPSLVDVFLTNKPNCFSDCFNIDLGI